MQTLRSTRNDLTNKTFGELTVIGPRRSTPYGKTGRFKSEWFCRCSCGNEVWRQADALIQGQSDSCGCKRIERMLPKIHRAHEAARKANRTHGMSRSTIYRIYNAMKDRCYNPASLSFSYYGGRGIKVYQRWIESFENFLADMGPSYSKGLSLERKDVNGDYSPENCVWIPRSQQVHNRQNTLRLTPTLTISEFCGNHRVSYDLVWHTYHLFKAHPQAFEHLMQILDNQSIM